MAITRVGSTKVDQNAAATSTTPATPAGTTVDDILLALVISNTNNAWPAVSGWTLRDSVLGNSLAIGLFWKWATASEPANQTIGGLPSVRYQSILVAYRGVDKTTPFDVAGSNNTYTTTQGAIPAITPVTVGAMIVAMRAAAHASTVDASTISYTSSNGTIDPSQPRSTLPSTNNQTGGIATKVWASGAFTMNLVGNLAVVQNRVIVAALRPAPAATPFRGWGIQAA